MMRKLRKFLASPAGKRVVMWALPILIAYIQRKVFSEKRDKQAK